MRAPLPRCIAAESLLKLLRLALEASDHVPAPVHLAVRPEMRVRNDELNRHARGRRSKHTSEASSRA